MQAGWNRIAQSDIEDIKEFILTGYKDGAQFQPDDPQLIGSGYQLVLDFGCGLGRNFALLNSVSDRVHAFDLPDMVEQCRLECTESIDLLTADWSAIKRHKYDLIFAWLVVQHLDLPVLETYLKDWSTITTCLYLHTRCFLDDGGGNVLKTVLASSLYDVGRCDIPVNEAMSLRKPSGTHFRALLRARESAGA